MPLNADVWDGLFCPYRCRYCYADSFRASLYTSFFDNPHIGLRYCKPEFFKPELDKMMKYRGKPNQGNEIQRAFGMELPIRIGIRFEDFHKQEGEKKIALEFLKHLSKLAYPVMVNTKSDLIGREDYVDALVSNPSKSAVHMTMISSSNELNKKLEPGAPNFQKRVRACRELWKAGIRIVARIEPFMVFLNDQEHEVQDWIAEMNYAGVRHITFDTYSYSAQMPGIRRGIERQGIDFDRMFLLMSDSQWLGSLLLGKFMDYMRTFDFSCSTFDFGNVPHNDQWVCCEVGDWWPPSKAGFSMGNTLSAIRYICGKHPHLVTWGDFETFVNFNGGWLSDSLQETVYQAWNLLGNLAYFPDWAQGIEPMGFDEKGQRIWAYDADFDFREEMLKVLCG